MNRDVKPYLEEVKNHLSNELLPYWKTHGIDEEFGGYLSFFDRDGNPTGETTKNLLAHGRMVYAFSSIHRSGKDEEGIFLAKAKEGFKFLLENFWDEKNCGWYWITEKGGTPMDRKKIIFGHSFVIYGLSEYYLTSGNTEALEWAEKTFDILQTHAADNLHGGYNEFFEEDWHRCKPGKYGGDRKTFDVHMHLMESFTNLYEATGKEIHKRRGRQIIDLICNRMLHPKYDTGIAQFSEDWTPKQAIIFRTVWGSDRDVQEPSGRPLNNTSYGHNVEFAWLLNHSIKILGIDESDYRNKIRNLYNHLIKYGIDWNLGGVYCEGPHVGEAREKNKEFWQQAESLVGMLDGTSMFDEDQYWKAYKNIHRFVFDLGINHEVGEWFPLLSSKNEILWDYMGHAWKINYHTVRSMLECEKRLSDLFKAK